MTITCHLYREGRPVPGSVDLERIDEVLGKPGVLLWVDVERPTEEKIHEVGRLFGFHPLALEDCLHPHQRPKIEQYDSYFFLVAYGTTIQDDAVREQEMAAFVSRDYLVTVRKDPAYDLKATVERWDAHPELAREGGGYLLYVLLDEVVDGYFSALEQYEDRSEQVEEMVFGTAPSTTAQTEIFRLKKDLLKFRRGVVPLREVLDALQRRTTEVVTVALEPYYRDVYDHVLRTADFVDNLRDILSSALEAHLSVVSNRLNEVMKKLTSWAAIILVPTLIAGIYGMNFKNMPELRWQVGYPMALGLMAASALILYRMFKKREWL